MELNCWPSWVQLANFKKFFLNRIFQDPVHSLLDFLTISSDQTSLEVQSEACGSLLGNVSDTSDLLMHVIQLELQLNLSFSKLTRCSLYRSLKKLSSFDPFRRKLFFKTFEPEGSNLLNYKNQIFIGSPRLDEDAWFKANGLDLISTIVKTLSYKFRLSRTLSTQDLKFRLSESLETLKLIASWLKCLLRMLLMIITDEC